mmetsp:Transcript_31606/g.103013  ORF Transcript_31606/g.103013 Transcript_31606/m.103013 type:complete len:308 (+) Transcript_31606:17-940(+)
MRVSTAPVRVVAQPRVRRSGRVSSKSAQANADMMSEVGTQVLSEKQLPAERYIACNRFKVQDNKGPKFEQRWANRKSRLAELDGFRFFTLLRRVDDDPALRGELDADMMSLTVWSDKKAFDAWRTGEAFKEAHGGGSLFGFADMIISSLRILKGGPKPAFFDGLLPIVNMPEAVPEAVGGWREVDADGVKALDADCFVAMNRFEVTDNEAFEKRWSERKSELLEFDGFKSFFLLRRDAVAADDGFGYSTLTIWRDRESFQKWRESQSFNKSHGQKKPEGAGGPPPFKTPPSPAFWEGILMLESPEGA